MKRTEELWYWGLKLVLRLRAVQGVGFEGLGFLATQPGWDVSGFGNEVDKLRGEVQLYLLNCWGKESCLQLAKLSGLWPKWWASSFDPTLSSEVGRDAYCNGYRGHGLKPTQGFASHVTLFVGLPKAICLPVLQLKVHSNFWKTIGVPFKEESQIAATTGLWGFQNAASANSIALVASYEQLEETLFRCAVEVPAPQKRDVFAEFEALAGIPGAQAIC